MNTHELHQQCTQSKLKMNVTLYAHILCYSHKKINGIINVLKFLSHIVE